MDVILIAVIVLGATGLISALVLFFASHKFAVHEDPRIGQIAEILPQANCGGCGFPGCSGFAAACVKAADEGSLEGKFCPVGGQQVIDQVGAILGIAAQAAAPVTASGEHARHAAARAPMAQPTPVTRVISGSPLLRASTRSPSVT